MSDILGRDVGRDFLSIGQMWISNSRFLVDNMFCAAALWGLWKLRNVICFQGTVWRSVLSLLISILTMIINWRLLYPVEKRLEFDSKLEKLKRLATSLPSLLGGTKWMENVTISCMRRRWTGSLRNILKKWRSSWLMLLTRVWRLKGNGSIY
jgi:hypothetical protein